MIYSINVILFIVHNDYICGEKVDLISTNIHSFKPTSQIPRYSVSACAITMLFHMSEHQLIYISTYTYVQPALKTIRTVAMQHTHLWKLISFESEKFWTMLRWKCFSIIFIW